MYVYAAGQHAVNITSPGKREKCFSCNRSDWLYILAGGGGGTLVDMYCVFGFSLLHILATLLWFPWVVLSVFWPSITNATAAAHGRQLGNAQNKWQHGARSINRIFDCLPFLFILSLYIYCPAPFSRWRTMNVEHYRRWCHRYFIFVFFFLFDPTSIIMYTLKLFMYGEV